jgi:hypothetical protein
MTHRLFGFIIVLFSILVLPYWIYIPILFIAIVIFPFFWEGILLALLIDVLHGPGITISWPFISPLTWIVLTVLVVFIYMRGSLRNYV